MGGNNMPMDTSDFAFPKLTKKSKKVSNLNKGTKKKERVKEEVIVFSKEVDSMIDFYELHRGDMVSVENYRFTKKLKEQASKWIRDVMESQKCDDVQDVMSAWQQSVLHAAEKSHFSHKVGSFMNMFWLIKNDSNYLEVMDGKYDKEFRNNAKPRENGSIGSGSPEDFRGVASGPSGIVI
jgi:hypothetical protein